MVIRTSLLLFIALLCNRSRYENGKSRRHFGSSIKVRGRNRLYETDGILTGAAGLNNCP